MSRVAVWIIFSILQICHSIPDGYILDVTHDCGAANAGGQHVNASVTIKSDLHALGKLMCTGSSGVPVTVKMPPIDNSNTEVTTRLFYTGDASGTVGTDCFFFHPNGESNLYVTKLEVWWGFANATLMEDYETYTLACTTNGYSKQNVEAKNIDDNHMAITSGFVHNMGSAYIGTRQLNLMDILDKVIDGKEVTMGKKVFLELSISGGTEQGLTPYDCFAENSDGSKSYKILNAGCGDGIIFKKTAGFVTTGTKSRSPFFKVFKLIESSGNTAAVKYKCSFTTCNNTCDGSSCSLPSRRKRSTDMTDRLIGMTSSGHFKVQTRYPFSTKTVNVVRDIDINKEIERIRLSLATTYLDLKNIELLLAINFAIIGVVFLLSIIFEHVNTRRRKCSCHGQLNKVGEDRNKIKTASPIKCVEEGKSRLRSTIPDNKQLPCLILDSKTDISPTHVPIEVPDFARMERSVRIKPCDCGPGCRCDAVQGGKSCKCDKPLQQGNVVKPCDCGPGCRCAAVQGGESCKCHKPVDQKNPLKSCDCGPGCRCVAVQGGESCKCHESL